MSTDTPRSQESTGTITGPHDGTDRDGDLDHRYWRCRRCGLESTDPRLREGCFRCGPAARGGRRERPDSDGRRDHADEGGRVDRPDEGGHGDHPDEGGPRDHPDEVERG